MFLFRNFRPRTAIILPTASCRTNTKQALLHNARKNIAGLLQINDALATGMAKAEDALKSALAEIAELKERHRRLGQFSSRKRLARSCWIGSSRTLSMPQPQQMLKP